MGDFSPKHPIDPMKKWASEPTLLGDYGDDWIKEWDNKEENGVSFTEKVAQPSLDNVTKRRVQLRPKQRRPPSRGFVKSMASLDFDISSVPEEINEDEEEEDEEDTKEDLGIVNDEVKLPVKPTVAPKPSDQNGAWKLPTLDSNILLKKTSSESKSKDSAHETDITMKTPEAPEDPLPTSETPPSVLQKGKQKRRSKRFKFQLFKIRGTGKEREEKDSDTNGNLADNRCLSVDSGGMPLGGEETPKGWRNRRRRKNSEGERKRLSWLMQLFHVKKANDDTKTSTTNVVVAPLPSNGNHGNTHSSDANEVEKDKTQTNGHVSEVKPEIVVSAANALNNDDEEEDSPETVSDLKKKFERISAGF